MKLSPAAGFMAFIGLITVLAVVAGISMIDQPSLARLRKLDSERESALQMLKLRIHGYRTEHGRLPESLEQLSLQAQATHDLATGQPYEYRVQGPAADSYTLCATFDTSPEDQVPEERRSFDFSEFRHAGPGHQCFDEDAGPQSR